MAEERASKWKIFLLSLSKPKKVKVFKYYKWNKETLVYPSPGVKIPSFKREKLIDAGMALVAGNITKSISTEKSDLLFVIIVI